MMTQTETNNPDTRSLQEILKQKIRAMLRSRKPVRYYVGRLITYTLLSLGAVVMLFPMLWMLGASLKPSWHMLTQPIGFTSEWIHTQAGNSVQGLPLW